jgi:hypothetical protein
MTVAAFIGVMASVFRIRWLLTVHCLELALRIVVLTALFRRPAATRR